jgi:hypothetical protein
VRDHVPTGYKLVQRELHACNGLQPWIKARFPANAKGADAIDTKHYEGLRDGDVRQALRLKAHRKRLWGLTNDSTPQRGLSMLAMLHCGPTTH